MQENDSEEAYGIFHKCGYQLFWSQISPSKLCGFWD